LGKKNKIRLLSIVAALAFLPLLAFSASQETVSDGPYLFFENGKLNALWIRNGILKHSEVNADNFSKFSRKFKFKFSLDELHENHSSVINTNNTYKEVDDFAIISDLHGEYQNYILILKRAGIIDKDLSWNFGKGHLVILGDIFDRGPMVTEILWHLYGLSMQASAAGGKVHIILGNHEYLILTGDARFVNEKYRYVELITGRPYSTLFGRGSVLGDWLRKMPVAVKINDILLTHAGISMELVNKKVEQEKINKLFADLLLGPDEANRSTYLPQLDEETGKDILSYRGYFTDKMFCETSLDTILNFYEVRRMIIGHTTQPEVKTMFNNKLLVTDAGLMNYHSGQLLLYSRPTFYRIMFNGRKFKIFDE
jgi:hypothetical protein